MAISCNKICTVLEEIDLMRNNCMINAKVVLVKRNEHSSVKVTLWSVKELEEYLEKANKLFCADISVKWHELPKEEALRIPEIVKMANAFPPNLPTLRIVEIVGVDRQTDGGTHVRNLREIGKIELIKTQNKGKNNRRIYFKLN